MITGVSDQVQGRWVLRCDGQETDCTVEWDEDRMVTTVTPAEYIDIPAGHTFTIEQAGPS
jgi:hypothetical protein